MYLPDRLKVDEILDPQPPGRWESQDDSPSVFSYRSIAQSQRTKRSRSLYQERGVARNRILSRRDLCDIADSTLAVLDSGSYCPRREDNSFDLKVKIDYTNENTEYYSPDDVNIAGWSEASIAKLKDHDTKLLMKEYSTLVGARELHKMLELHSEVENKTIGVLNFASAQKPGGGFMNGAQAQEESIARSSTLYPSLVTDAADPFYSHYRHDPDNPYYTHAMVYSPGVVLFRGDRGQWKKPVDVDILTSAAVNAGEVRQNIRWENEVHAMRARVKAAEAARERNRETNKQREFKEKIEKQNAEELKKTKKLKKAEEERLKEEEEREKVEKESNKSAEDGTANSDGMEVDVDDEKIADVEMQDLTTSKVAENQTVPDEAPPSDTLQGSSRAIEASLPSEPNPWVSEVSKNKPIVKLPTPNPVDIPLPVTPPILPDPLQPEAASTSTKPLRKSSPSPERPPLATVLAMAEEDIIKEMRERIGRLLYLFHERGAGSLVLGAYGTGVFQNSVEVIAQIFYDYLVRPDGKFHNVFESVVFAILGESTIRDFRKVFKDIDLDAEDGAVDDESDEGEDVQDGKGDDGALSDRESPLGGKDAKEEVKDHAKTPDRKPVGPRTKQSTLFNFFKSSEKKSAKTSTKTVDPVEQKQEQDTHTHLASVTAKLDAMPETPQHKPRKESSNSILPDTSQTVHKPMPKSAPI